MIACGKYIGDNDATCPQLRCIRASGHGGFCDNVHTDVDYEAWKQAVLDGRWKEDTMIEDWRDTEPDNSNHDDIEAPRHRDISTSIEVDPDDARPSGEDVSERGDE